MPIETASLCRDDRAVLRPGTGVGSVGPQVGGLGVGQVLRMVIPPYGVESATDPTALPWTRVCGFLQLDR